MMTISKSSEPWTLKTPIVFLIFNRPETTAKVFETIRQAKPPQLFIIADGPRPEKNGEDEQCQKTREVVQNIDWDCEVFCNYSEVNLGCQERVASGLTWVFEQVEEAIIIEDDCLPHPSFFQYCEELLQRYRHDLRVMHIGGNNLQTKAKRTDYSYYFSNFVHIWGWATWRRAWKQYDATMSLWPTIRDGNWLLDRLGDRLTSKYWTEKFQETYHNEVNTWGYRWTFSCWINGGWMIVPNVNLVVNLGFGGNATHTFDSDHWGNHLTLEGVEFPLQHPPFMIQDRKTDIHTHHTKYYNPGFKVFIINRIKGIKKRLSFFKKKL